MGNSSSRNKSRNKRKFPKGPNILRLQGVSYTLSLSYLPQFKNTPLFSNRVFRCRTWDQTPRTNALPFNG
eukprot:1273574-Amorphochlora_amoeboformis.AAC.2